MSTDLNNQYAPPKSAVADVGTDGEDADKASRSARLGAAMLDGLIAMIGLIPSYARLIMTAVQRRGADAGSTNAFAAWVSLSRTGGWFYVGVVWILVVLAVNLYFMRVNGQSIGKRVVGIKIVRTDRSPASLARIFLIRSVLNTVFTLLPLVGSFYSLIDVLMIFGAPRRCAHDYLADTIVIKA